MVYISFNEYNEEQAPVALVDTIKDMSVMQYKMITQVSMENEKSDQRRKYLLDNVEQNMQEQMKVLNVVILHKLAVQEKRDKHLSEKMDKLFE